MIDSTSIYNGCKPVLHVQNTRVRLDEPSMYRHGLGTQETERSNMTHIVDMINMEMFTIETTSSHVKIGLGLVIWVMLHSDNRRDVDLSGSS